MDIQKQCKDCVYLKRANGLCGIKFCHHLLETNKRRVVGENGQCLSKTTVKQGVKKLIKKEPRDNKCKKKVKAVEDGIVFESMREAEKYYHLAIGRVSEVTNKPNKTARGQHFITV